MIYVDSSVILAWLLAEDRRPTDDLFKEQLISSRLLSYEVLNRLQAYDAVPSIRLSAVRLLGRISLLELHQDILARAEFPFPKPVRTLDALHLATALWVAVREGDLRIATYDKRMAETAASLGIEPFILG